MQAEAVHNERDQLADDMRRARDENEELRAQRDDLQQTLQTLAGRMTQVADEILSQIRRRETPGDPAER